MNKALYNVSSPAAVADELGVLRAEIKELKNTQRFLEDILKSSDNPVAEGTLFTTTVVTQERDVVSWKDVAAKLDPSRQLITAHTTHKTVVSVRVTGKKK